MERLFSYFLVFLSFNLSFAAQQPKLIVVIVLDQVPYDYIVRFEPYFGEGGFRYLLNNGANFTNARYQYAYTKTAPGHAAIITGANSNRNGIVGNRWYDSTKRKSIGCVDDTTERTLGSAAGGRSPRTLLVSTIGDVLRKSTNSQSKVIGISNKDRSAILLAGISGTAYWIDDSIVVSSTYYMNELPSWVVEFNQSGIFQKYFGLVWTELMPEVAAKICDEDDVPYETNLYGMGRAFPHKIVGKDSTRITPSYYNRLSCSPFATEVLLEFARTVFVRESLDARGVCNMLCLGISAMDEIGHLYGPNSHETFDAMLRQDKMLSEFFLFLEEKIGLRNCLIVLSADHGIAPIPEYKKKIEPQIKATRISTAELFSRANRMLENSFGKSTFAWVSTIIDAQIYLNDEAAKEKGIPMEIIRKTLKDSLTGSFPISKAYTFDELLDNAGEGSFFGHVKKSFYPMRSGDVMVILQPFCIIDSSPEGTNHGMLYSYDVHVPLMIAGASIKAGQYHTAVSPIDIAPTLAAILGVYDSQVWEGRVLSEVLKTH